VIVQCRDENSLFPESRDKGVDFPLQDDRLAQIQRPTLPINALKAEKSGQHQRGTAAAPQNGDRDVPESLDEAHAIDDTRGSAHNSGKLTAQSIQRLMG